MIQIENKEIRLTVKQFIAVLGFLAGIGISTVAGYTKLISQLEANTVAIAKLEKKYEEKEKLDATEAKTKAAEFRTLELQVNSLVTLQRSK